MSDSKHLAPEICPRCQNDEGFRITETHAECRRCGYSFAHDAGKREEIPQEQPTSILDMFKAQGTADAEDDKPPAYHMDEDIDISGRMMFKDEVSRWARSSWESAVAYLNRGAWEDAARSLKKIIDVQPEIPDAHYWLAMLATDRDEKRGHLEKALAYAPHYAEARKQLLLLDGKLSESEAKTLDNPYAEPEVRYAGGAVSVVADDVRCAACGSSQMGVDDKTGQPYCLDCGTVNEKLKQVAASSDKGLMQELVKRRSKPIQWQVGERLLHCKSCGAERTIARKMASYCPFCGSRQVAVRDVLGSFQQPDGVVPFRVGRKRVEKMIYDRLETWGERIKGLFNTNRVKRVILEPDFMPYWVFDADLTLRRTITYYTPRQDNYGRELQYKPKPTDRTHTDEMPAHVGDQLVCGVSVAPTHLLKEIEPFDLSKSRPYSSDLLAKFSAQIYDIDFDRASLIAREFISERVRKSNQRQETGIHISVLPLIYAMQFRLLLLPVWVVTLYEVDDDVRIGVVNGQTGEIALGKSRRKKN